MYYHVMRFVVDAEYYLWIMNEPEGQLFPEFTELLGCGCSRIGAISYHLDHPRG